MTLHLPDVLPYDFVDEMIDSMVRFGNDLWEVEWDGSDWPRGTEMVTPYAVRLNEEGKDTQRSNYGRALFELLEDVPSRTPTEDEDGYINCAETFSMVWTADDLTDEEISEYLGE